MQKIQIKCSHKSLWNGSWHFPKAFTPRKSQYLESYCQNGWDIPNLRPCFQLLQFCVDVYLAWQKRLGFQKLLNYLLLQNIVSFHFFTSLISRTKLFEIKANLKSTVSEILIRSSIKHEIAVDLLVLNPSRLWVWNTYSNTWVMVISFPNSSISVETFQDK